MEGSSARSLHNSPRDPGLRPRDQSCHLEVRLHLHLVGNQLAYASRGNHGQRVPLKEASCPYPPTDLNKGDSERVEVRVD